MKIPNSLYRMHSSPIELVDDVSNVATAVQDPCVAKQP